MISGFSDLEERLDALLESTENIRTEIKRENKTRDVRIRTNRIATIAAIVAAVVGIFVGGIGVGSAHNAANSARNANRSAAVINANSTLSRKASCDQYNIQQRSLDEAQKDQIRVVVTAVTPSTHTPKLDKQIADFYIVYDKQVDKDYPQRDCTPIGIARYLHLPLPKVTPTGTTTSTTRP